MQVVNLYKMQYQCPITSGGPLVLRLDHSQMSVTQNSEKSSAKQVRKSPTSFPLPVVSSCLSGGCRCWKWQICGAHTVQQNRFTWDRVIVQDLFIFLSSRLSLQQFPFKICPGDCYKIKHTYGETKVWLAEVLPDNMCCMSKTHFHLWHRLIWNLCLYYMLLSQLPMQQITLCIEFSMCLI